MVFHIDSIAICNLSFMVKKVDENCLDTKKIKQKIKDLRRKVYFSLRFLLPHQNAPKKAPNCSGIQCTVIVIVVALFTFQLSKDITFSLML